MSSPSQRHGGCGHMMAGFDPHSYCARSHDKKKGQDPCVEKPDSLCTHCNALSPKQLAQLSTPSYKLKKEKREARSTPSKEPSTEDTLSPTLVDPALLSEVGVVDGQSTSRSPGLSAPPEKKRKSDSKKSSTSKSVKSDKAVKTSTSRPPASTSTDKSASDRPSSSSTDSRFTELDQKWSDRFNRLEALLMARTLDTPSDQTFTTVQVTPTHAPPAHALRPEPFLKPTSQNSQLADRPSTIDPPTTDTVSKHRSATKATISQPSEPTSKLTSQRQPASAYDRRDSSPASDSDSDSLSSDRPPLELSDEQEFNASKHDQSLSEEQSYRETMRGIRSYMGCHHVPDLDSSTTTADDNPFAGPKLQTAGKVSVNLPIDEWLCKKMSKLNLTLVQGYPTRTSEAGGLLRDQFVWPARSTGKWYGLHTDPKKDSSDTISSWNTNSSRLNSTYLRIARQAGITNPPLSRPISQESLRKWEKLARESSVICNQAAGFNRCLLKIQQNMQSQLKDIRVESKGKSAAKASAAVDELQYLLDFNSSVCQAMAKSMEHLTDFVFVNLANTTLLRRDSYLQYLKAGVKADTLNALRTAPLQLEILFPDTVIKCAEEEISSFDKGQSSSIYKKRRYHPYEREDTRSDNRRQERPAWKNLSRGHHKKGKQQFSSRPAKGQQSYK